MVTNMEKPYVVGMDIGGTNTVFGIVDQRGNVLATDSVKTQSYAKIEDYVEAVTSKLLPLIESVGGVDKIKGMGVGAPNGNYYNGTIEFAPNLPWRGVIPLAALFEEKIGVPTALTNDANAAAIGEMTYGAARGMKDFIMITLGTGVGSGIVINGQLVYGHDGFAGELGHVVVRRENGRQCGCGRKGCLETYCSATGVARTAREFLVARPEPSLLRDIPAEEIENVVILSGEAVLTEENGGEQKLTAVPDGTVVFVGIKEWKSAPCVERNKAGEATFTLTAAPLPEGAVVGIVGDLSAELSWNINAPIVMTAGENNTWTATAEVKDACVYKYFFSLDGGKYGKDNQCNDLLNHFQLHQCKGASITGKADTVGRHLASIFEEGDAP